MSGDLENGEKDVENNAKKAFMEFLLRGEDAACGPLQVVISGLLSHV